MPGRGSYGPAGKWIHDRAHRIMEDSPETPKNVAYAIATQQGHKVGKSPKGFRTPEGVREAKQKYELPKKEYQKTAAEMRLDALFGELEKSALVGLGETGNALMPQFAGQSIAGGIPASVQAAVTKGHINLPSYAQRAGIIARNAPKGGSAVKAVAPKIGFLGRLLKRAEAFPGYAGPIQKQTEDNTDFRRVIFTGKHAQLVLMSIQDEIGEETHEAVDQFFRVDGGKGAVIMNGIRREVQDGDAFLVPAGTRHNVINTSETEPLKLYTVYSPPNHQPGTVHKTKEDAVRAEAEGTDKKPVAADIVPGKEKTADMESEGEEREEEGVAGKLIPREQILRFFQQNPNPDDEQVHELAEEKGTDPHTLETQIYGLLSDKLKQKTAAGGGGAALGGELLGLPGGIYGGLREAGLRGALGAGLGGGAGLAGGIGARHLIQKYLTGGEFGRRHPIAATIAESLPLAVGSTVGGAVGSQLLKR